MGVKYKIYSKLPDFTCIGDLRENPGHSPDAEKIMIRFYSYGKKGAIISYLDTLTFLP
jgi:hypothetical protein